MEQSNESTPAVANPAEATDSKIAAPSASAAESESVAATDAPTDAGKSDEQQSTEDSAASPCTAEVSNQEESADFGTTYTSREVSNLEHWESGGVEEAETGETCEDSNGSKNAKSRGSWLKVQQQKLAKVGAHYKEVAAKASEKLSEKAAVTANIAAEKAQLASTAAAASGRAAAASTQKKLKEGAETLAQKYHNVKAPKRNVTDAISKMGMVFRPGRRGSNSSMEDEASGMSHSQFIVDNPGNLHDVYEIDTAAIGTGAYGVVRQACHKDDEGRRVAVKVITKAVVKDKAMLKKETELMKELDHPNIIRLFETFQDFRCYYLVMELCTGGELFDRIIDAGHFNEFDAAMMMKQIFQAVHYLHEMNIVHRDLKPENFLFASKDDVEAKVLKIIDFGLAARTTGPEQTLNTKCGTPYYVAPQVLASVYDSKADVWSCGVIMYVLLCGYPPFYGETDEHVLAKVRLGNYSFNASDWKDVSEDAKNLVRSCLCMNPEKRCSAEEALKHVWTVETAPAKTDVPLPSNLVGNLKNFRSANRLKKAALHFIAHHMEDKVIEDLREVFVSLDTNEDGFLSYAEVRNGLEKGLTSIPADLQQILEELDTSGNGLIDYTEFIAGMLEKKIYMREDVCWHAFKFFDQDGNGKISMAELSKVLSHDGVSNAADEQIIADIMKSCDEDGDGSIDFKEFMHMMQGGEIKRSNTAAADAEAAAEGESPASPAEATESKATKEAATADATAVAASADVSPAAAAAATEAPAV